MERGKAGDAKGGGMGCGVGWFHMCQEPRGCKQVHRCKQVQTSLRSPGMNGVYNAKKGLNNRDMLQNSLSSRENGYLHSIVYNRAFWWSRVSRGENGWEAQKISAAGLATATLR